MTRISVARATVFMSTRISNTASAVVILPIAISVIKLLIDAKDDFLFRYYIILYIIAKTLLCNIIEIVKF
jgi:di/tricarboxylate transporter